MERDPASTCESGCEISLTHSVIRRNILSKSSAEIREAIEQMVLQTAFAPGFVRFSPGESDRRHSTITSVSSPEAESDGDPFLSRIRVITNTSGRSEVAVTSDEDGVDALIGEPCSLDEADRGAKDLVHG